MKTFVAIIHEDPRDEWRATLYTRKTIQAHNIKEAHAIAELEAQRFIASISPKPRGAFVETLEVE